MIGLPVGDSSGKLIGIVSRRDLLSVFLWQRDGHIALVFPGPYARIVPGGTSAGEPAAAGASA